MFILGNGSLCPVCEKGKLKEIKKDLVFKYKNRSKRFEGETVFECDLCNHEIVSQEANRRIEKELTDFRRNINGLLLGDQLKAIRKSLGLNIKKMAKLLSVNEKTVGRYENGKITQSEQIDKLYRILQKFPSAANILRPDVSIPISAFRGHIIVAKMYSYIPEPERAYNTYLVPDEYFDLKGSENATGC